MLNAGRRYLKAEDLSGKVFVTSGLGGMSGAQAKAAVIAGCVGIIAEVRATLLLFCLLPMCRIRTLIPLIRHVPQVTLTSQTEKNPNITLFLYLSFSFLSIFHGCSTLYFFTHWIDQIESIWIVTYDCFTNNAE